MLVSVLLLPVVVAGSVLAVQRLLWPPYLALMAAALAYGILADRHLQAYGRAFGLGFANAIEQVGLLVVVGAVLAAVGRSALPLAGTAAAGAICGTLTTTAAGLALLQPRAEAASRRLLLAVLLALAVQALVPPSPVATAAAWVLRAELGRALAVAIPVATLAAVAAWMALRHLVAADKDWGRWDSVSVVAAALLALMVVYALAQVPSEPLGARMANRFVANLGRPFVIAVLGLVAVAIIWRQSFAAAGTDARWAPLVLTVGAAGGLSFVLNETGAPELLAEAILDPRLGLLVPFLAAAVVKTMQGNSLTAVLTAVGMTEPMLADLGLADGNGRLIAAAAAGAGSIALCHINDPLFWVAAHLTGLPPGRALIVITGGSALVSIVAVVLLAGLRVVL